MDALFGLAALTMRYQATFLLVLFRLGGMVAFAPVFGHRSLPVTHRVGLAGLLALILTPLLPPATLDGRGGLPGVVLVVAGELFVGLVIGFVAALALAAISAGAEMCGFQMGLGIASQYDPAFGAQMTVFTGFWDTFAILLFLGANGHHLLLQAVAASFQRLPPGTVRVQGAVGGGVAALGTALFRSGLELAAPLVGVLLVVNVVLALLTRVSPQTNVFFLGVPITVAVGLLGAAQGFPWLARTVERVTLQVVGDLDLLLTGAAHGVR
jgi:flagellar biosynthetic protein FliR